MQHELKYKYKKIVSYYFTAEYSDYSIPYLIDKVKVLVPDDEDVFETRIEELQDSELLKMRMKWRKKINKICESYRKADKPPSDAARKISSVLKSFTGVDFI